jgi:hypothetical protein
MAGIEKAAWALFGCVGPANWGPRCARVVVQWQGGVVGLGGWSCRNGRPARCFGALKLEDVCEAVEPPVEETAAAPC